MNRYKILKKIYILILLFFPIIIGCAGTSEGNRGRMGKYAVLSPEPEWIRNGEAIDYEGKRWFPAEEIEIFKDSEVVLVGQQQGIQFFVDKVDIKPYNRVYTKFGRNQFRVFEPRSTDD